MSEKQASVFNIKDVTPRREKVYLKDIIFPAGYQARDYMVDSTGDDGLGLVDDNIYLEKKDNGRYEILDGLNRLSALKVNGEECVSALVVKHPTKQQKAIITLVKNNARKRNLTKELEALEQLEAAGTPYEWIRDKINMSKGTMYRLKRLRNLPEVLYKALKQNKISDTHANAIANLSVAEQKKCAKIFEAEGVITGEQIAEIKQVKKVKLADTISQDLVQPLSSVEHILRQIEKLSDKEKEQIKAKI